MTDQIENLLKEIEGLMNEIQEMYQKGDPEISTLKVKLQEKLQEFKAALQMERWSEMSNITDKHGLFCNLIMNMK